MSIDIGNECVDCRRDTSPGSGLFVNRISADNGELDGWMCADCQAMECDICGIANIDYEFVDSVRNYPHQDLVCIDCYEEEEV